MSIAAIHRLLERNAAGRVLVLAHATTLLRSQYVDRLVAEAPPFDFAEYLPRWSAGHVPFDKLTATVVVALPQSLMRLKNPGAFDLVVVDEAHLFYGEKMVTEIIERVGAKRVLLLTGTPSPFVARGLKLHAVTMQELYLDGKKAADGPWVADSRIKLLQSKYDVSRRQYNADGEVKRGVRYLGRQTTETLNDLLSCVDSISATWKRWPAVPCRMGKTMIKLPIAKGRPAGVRLFQDCRSGCRCEYV